MAFPDKVFILESCSRNGRQNRPGMIPARIKIKYDPVATALEMCDEIHAHAGGSMALACHA